MTKSLILDAGEFENNYMRMPLTTRETAGVQSGSSTAKLLDSLETQANMQARNITCITDSALTGKE